MSRNEVLLSLPASMWAFEIVPFLRIHDVLSLRSLSHESLSFFTASVVPVLRQLYSEALLAFNTKQLSENESVAQGLISLCRESLAKLSTALVIVRCYTANVHPCIHMAMAMFCYVLRPKAEMYSMKEIKVILRCRPEHVSNKFLKNFLRPPHRGRIKELQAMQTWTLGDVRVSCDMAGLMMELVTLYLDFQQFQVTAGEEAQAFIRLSENCRQYEKSLLKLSSLKVPVFRTQRPGSRLKRRS